jgi:gliding motility-associated-like protein
VPNEFYAYKVTSDGVALTPVKSPSFAATDRRGYLKISPDGTKVAIAHQADSAFLVYKFNDATGRVSNELNLPLITEGNKPYGVEFSANSEKLYVHASNDAFNPLSDDNPPEPTHVSTLFQFDVTLSSDDAIVNSRKIIHEGVLFRGSLQLGPDRKIYRSLARSYSEGIPLLGVIENPEEDGTDCNYKHASVGLLGRISTQGLPPFIASIFSQVQIIAEGSSGIQSKIDNGEALDLCIGDDVSIFSESLSGIVKYNWFFNGGTTAISNDPILLLDDITIANSGNYSLRVFHIDLCGNSNTLNAEFTVNILDFPIIISPVDFTNCDEDGIPDGFTNFNLEGANDIITNGDSNLTTSWHRSFNEADTKTNEINPFPYNNSTSNSVFARVENSAGCHSVATVNLQVSNSSFPSSYAGESIEVCDNDDDNDGLYLFDLSQFSSNILSQFTDPDLSVHYYRNVEDAHIEQNEISSEQLYMSETPFSQTLYVRVESNMNGDCFGIGPYVDLTVFSSPEFEVNPEVIICQNISSETTLETYNPNGIFTYNWTGPNGYSSNGPNAIVTSGGIYSVVASKTLPNGSLCESLPQSVSVIESSIGSIDVENVIITDLSTNNTIFIDLTNLGIGDYEFAIYSGFGPFQDSPLFEMVAAGDHILYVRDKNKCGISELEVSVIGFPNYFTPNNDGTNDSWQFIGVNQKYYTSLVVNIFDRFGKIIAILDTPNSSWDGNYNGKQLPESDYWFDAEIINKEGEIKNRKGHFSLIRRNPN